MTDSSATRKPRPGLGRGLSALMDGLGRQVAVRPGQDAQDERPRTGVAMAGLTHLGQRPGEAPHVGRSEGIRGRPLCILDAVARSLQ